MLSWKEEVNLGYSVNWLIGVFLLLFSAYLIYQVSQAPYMLDDFSAPHRLINISKPKFSRGLIWVYMSLFFFTIPLNLAHVVIALIHLSNGVLLIYIIHKLWGKKLHRALYPVFFIFFLTNPTTSDNLLWLLAGYPIVTLFFGLIGTVFLIRFMTTELKFYLSGFVIFASLAYFTSEHGLLLFPLYVLVMIVVHPLRFSHSWRYLTDSIIRFLILWIAPYVAYRFFLYLFFSSLSATQPYKFHFNVFSITRTFIKLFQYILNSMPYFVWAIAGIALVTMLIFYMIYSLKLRVPYNNLFPVTRTEIFSLGYFFILIVFLTGPFILLNEWVEYRFIYVSSSFFVVWIWLFIGLILSDFFNLSSMYRRTRMAIAFIVLFSLSILSIRSYDQWTLKPIFGAAFYVNNYINVQKEKFGRLPEHSTVLVVLQMPTYKTPQYLFRGDIAFALRTPWVPRGMKKSGYISDNVTSMHMPNELKLINNNVILVNHREYIDYKILERSLRQGEVYAYSYDGETLKKINGNHLIIRDENGNLLQNVKLSVF